ncbi:MAG: CdaR family protein [Myxococcota bacterium]
MPIRFGTLLLAWLIAMALWSMAHGTSEIERGVDIPIVFEGVPDDLVLVGQSARAVNIRVLGSRAALRDVGPSRIDYPVEVSGAQAGDAIYEVDAGRIEEQLPTGARIVSRSPASLELRFARRGRKSLRVRADVTGDPAAGYELGVIDVEPTQVWLTGERREVLRMREAVTETIDIRGLSGSVERKVRLSLVDHVWMEEDDEITVRVEIVAIPEPPVVSPDAAGENPSA